MRLMEFFSQPCSPKQQLYLYCATAIALAILQQIYQFYLHPIFFPLDDPYIVLHNAQILHSGTDANYPKIPALTGTTSAVHLALVTFLIYWVNPVNAIWLTLWLGIIAYGLGLLCLAFQFKASFWQTLLFLLTGFTLAYIPFQLLNGLETGLMLAAMVWTLVLANSSTRNWPWQYLLPFICGLLPFIRPELALLSLLLLSYRVWIFQQQNSLQKTCQLLARDLTLAAAASLPWIVWYWVEIGEPFPATIAAKMAYAAEVNLPLSYKIQWSLVGVTQLIFAINYLGFFAMVALLLTSPLGRVGLIYILIFLAFYTYFFPGMLQIGYNMGRYIYPCIPILLYGLISNINNPDKKLRWGSNIIICLILCHSLWYLTARWHNYLAYENMCKVEFPSITQWCKQNLPPDAVLLVHDAGYLAFTSSFHLVDMVGLKTPSSVQYHQQFTIPSAGKNRNQAIAAIIKNNKINYLVIGKQWDHVFLITDGLKALGFKLVLLRPSTQNPFSYAVYGVRP